MQAAWEVWAVCEQLFATSHICFSAVERLTVSQEAAGIVHLASFQASSQAELLSWLLQSSRAKQPASVDVIIDICA